VQPSDRGAWGEAVVAADLLSAGYQPYKAVSPGAPYDFIVDTGTALLRVEVRCVTVYNVPQYTPMTNWHDPTRVDVGAYVWPDGVVAYSPALPGTTYTARKKNTSGILAVKNRKVKVI